MRRPIIFSFKSPRPSPLPAGGERELVAVSRCAPYLADDISAFTFVRHGVEWQREKSHSIHVGRVAVRTCRLSGPSRLYESLYFW